MATESTTEIELTDGQWTAVMKALITFEGRGSYESLDSETQRKLRNAQNDIEIQADWDE